jgi:hypothetical protein
MSVEIGFSEGAGFDILSFQMSLTHTQTSLGPFSIDRVRYTLQASADQTSTSSSVQTKA